MYIDYLMKIAKLYAAQGKKVVYINLEQSEQQTKDQYTKLHTECAPVCDRKMNGIQMPDRT
jgi:hypothetical protein